MKLTKLLPFATVASVAAIVVPTVTSCGASVKVDVKDLKNWKPSIEKKKGSIQASELTKAYLQDAKDNKKIISEDYIWYMVQMLGENVPSDATGYIEANTKDVNVDKSTISMDIKLEVTYSGEKYVLSFSTKNIQVKAGYIFDGAGPIGIVPSPDMTDVAKLKQNKDWEVTAHIEGEGETIDLKNIKWDSKDEDIQVIAYSLTGYARFASYYISEIEIK